MKGSVQHGVNVVRGTPRNGALTEYEWRGILGMHDHQKVHAAAEQRVEADKPAGSCRIGRGAALQLIPVFDRRDEGSRNHQGCEQNECFVGFAGYGLPATDCRLRIRSN